MRGRKKKREYKIARFPSKHERAIFRERWEDVQRLSAERIWTREKRRAIRYMSESDAESAFISVKTGWELKTEEEYIEEAIRESEAKRPKQSWGEYSSSH